MDLPIDVDEPQEGDDPIDLPPFDWERLLRWLFVVGLVLWVLVGAVDTILVAYFADFTPVFSTDSEATSRIVVEVHRVSITVQSIAFRVWIASGVLLVLFWFRTRHAKPSTSN